MQPITRPTSPHPSYTAPVTRSKVIAILVLITVICLGLSALLLPESTDRAAEPVRLISFAPSQVVNVDVRLPDASTQRLSRRSSDAWEVLLPTTTDPAGARPVRWPASTDRVRAFLRILDRLRGLPASDSPPPASTTLTITSELGETATFGLPAASLGGRSVVHVQPRSAADPSSAPFVTTDELPRLLADGGIIHWLDQRAFAGLGGRVTEIAVTSAAGTMTIARRGAAWRIESPFPAPAEPALIDELLAALLTLPFASPTTPERASREPPPPYADATTITLTASTRRPSPDGSIATETTRHTLTTLGPVGQSGQVPVSLLAASVGPDTEPLLGPLAATIDAQRLTEIVRQPAFYIARRAVAAEPSDIQALALVLPSGTTIDLVRTPAGWARDGTALPTPDATPIEALVTLLTRTPAAVTAWSDQPLPQGSTPLATIDCRGLGGLTIATVSLAVTPLPDQAGATPPDSRAYALITAEQIARYYSPESAVDAVRWVAGLEPGP